MQALATRATRYFSTVRDAVILAIAPPAVMELGNVDGLRHELQDRGGLGHEQLPRGAQSAARRAPARIPRSSRCGRTASRTRRSSSSTSTARRRARSGFRSPTSTRRSPPRGASSYVNDFIDHGRVKRVYVQGDAEFAHAARGPRTLVRAQRRAAGWCRSPRSRPRQWTYGPQKLVAIQRRAGVRDPGRARAGHAARARRWTSWRASSASCRPASASSGPACRSRSKLSGSQAPLLYALSLLVVFLCLAALYESWSIPVAVLLVVPLGVLGAVLATWLRGNLRTTSTSRSACSRRSASRRRTRS